MILKCNQYSCNPVESLKTLPQIRKYVSQIWQYPDYINTLKKMTRGLSSSQFRDPLGRVCSEVGTEGHLPVPVQYTRAPGPFPENPTETQWVLRASAPLSAKNHGVLQYHESLTLFLTSFW